MLPPIVPGVRIIFSTKAADLFSTQNYKPSYSMVRLDLKQVIFES